MLIKVCGRIVYIGVGNWMEFWVRIFVKWIYFVEGFFIYVYVVYIGDVIFKIN